MPNNLEDDPLYLETMADSYTAKEWEETGSPIAARMLRDQSFVRAIVELGSVDAAETLVDQAEVDIRFDKKIIENFEV